MTRTCRSDYSFAPGLRHEVQIFGVNIANLSVHIDLPPSGRGLFNNNENGTAGELRDDGVTGGRTGSEVDGFQRDVALNRGNNTHQVFRRNITNPLIILHLPPGIIDFL